MNFPIEIYIFFFQHYYLISWYYKKPHIYLMFFFFIKNEVKKEIHAVWTWNAMITDSVGWVKLVQSRFRISSFKNIYKMKTHIRVNIVYSPHMIYNNIMLYLKSTPLGLFFSSFFINIPRRDVKSRTVAFKILWKEEEEINCKRKFSTMC